jgi:hypothetical protein
MAAVEVSTAYPLDGPTGYVYVAAGGVSQALAVLAAERAVRWFGRLLTSARRS